MKSRKVLLFKMLSLAFGCSMMTIVTNAQIPGDFIIWKFNSGEFNNKPLVNDSILYCGSMDKKFYALNIRTGNEIWHFAASYPITSSAAIENGIVCFESGNRLYGLDALTGNLLWSYVAKASAPGVILQPTDYHHSSPFIHNGIAYYGDEWGNMNGVNINTGTLAFQYTTSIPYTKASNKSIRCAPAIKDDIIYFGDYGANVYAISLVDSSVKWIHKITSPKWDGSVVSDMVIKDTVLYFGGYNNTFSPLSINTGNPVWSFTDVNTFLPSTPVFYKDNVIMGSTINSNKIHCLKMDNGTETWSIQAQGIFFVKPVIVHDSILLINSTEPFVSHYGTFYFINCKNGEIINHIHLPNASESSPVVVGDSLFLGRNDGMYAIDFSPYLERHDTSILVFNDSTKNVTINRDKDLGIDCSIKNDGDFCNTLLIAAEIEGDSNKINITTYKVDNIHAKPKENIGFGFRARPNKLSPGTYKITVRISSSFQPEVILFVKEINITVTDFVGIHDDIIENTSMAYPNPFVTSINFPVDFSQSRSALLSIYSIDGRQVFLKQFEIDCSGDAIIWTGCDMTGKSVRNGIYFYSIKTDENEIKGKIIKL
jgi:outer membrane protein assembly factor BamB